MLPSMQVSTSVVVCTRLWNSSTRRTAMFHRKKTIPSPRVSSSALWTTLTGRITTSLKPSRSSDSPVLFRIANAPRSHRAAACSRFCETYAPVECLDRGPVRLARSSVAALGLPLVGNQAAQFTWMSPTRSDKSIRAR
jgi:hypothetical protein